MNFKSISKILFGVLISFFTLTSTSFASSSFISLLSIADNPGDYCSQGYVNERMSNLIFGCLGIITFIFIVFFIISYLKSRKEKKNPTKNPILKIVIGFFLLLFWIIAIASSLILNYTTANPRSPFLLRTCTFNAAGKACADCKLNGTKGSLCKACEVTFDKFCEEPTIKKSYRTPDYGLFDSYQKSNGNTCD